MTQFFGHFQTLDTLIDEFKISSDTLKDHTVVIAAYDIDGYEGAAFVLLEDANGALFEVNGSHCSCYGLEDQWQPEAIDKQSLFHRCTHGRILTTEVTKAVAIFAQRTGHEIFEDKLKSLSKS